MHPSIPILMVFIGCCSNVVFLELIVREDPGCGNIVTFSQFVFISMQGFIFTVEFGRKKSAIPLSQYYTMVALFVVIQVVNNCAFVFDIPMPLHMIFRAGSLIANLFLGVILLKRKYPLNKYLAVLMITFGIVMATIASAQTNVKTHKEQGIDESSLFEYGKMSIGISVLTIALFLSAAMGIFQETIYSKYGKHPAEALFYNHALPLPAFILLSTDIYTHAQIFSSSAPLLVPVINTFVPKLWLFLVGNVITQYVCIKSVFILTTECTSLTVTLVVTLRKFVSLLFSIVYFKNSFTPVHWIGTLLVFGGTFVFTDVYGIISKKLTENSVKKEKKVE